MEVHFGIKVYDRKYGLKLERDKYAFINTKTSFSGRLGCCDYIDETYKTYTDEWCAKHFKDCMKNFDLSMEYLKLLDREKMNSELNAFLTKHKKFKEVKDLNDLNLKSGYYIMVLDEYSQLYIGTARSLKDRIVKHWSQTKAFDRLLCPIGAVASSKLSIDSFRALDTTRIYAYTCTNTYTFEDQYINEFSNEFLCNRTGGGYLEDRLIRDINQIKSRKMDVELSEPDSHGCALEDTLPWMGYKLFHTNE